MGNKNSGAHNTIWEHPKRDEIIRDLVLGNKTQLEIAAFVGVHSSQVSRFAKKHITEEMRREIISDARLSRVENATSILNAERLDIATTYDALARRVERLITDAEERDEPAFALAAMDGLRKVLRDIAQMQGKLAQNLTVNVSLAESKEWVTLRDILRRVVDEVPEAREPLLRHMRGEALSITREGDRNAGL